MTHYPKVLPMDWTIEAESAKNWTASAVGISRFSQWHSRSDLSLAGKLNGMEQAHIINSTTNLVGISTSPATANTTDITAILFNAGYLHHVGPNRINTTLARLLAPNGVRCLRMDFSGLGDSGANNDIHDNMELVTRDAQAAMDFMQHTFNSRKFVLFGLCSGALDSIHVAQQDSRVVGVIAVDGVGFRTGRFYFHHIVSHIAPRLFQRKHWRRAYSKGAAWFTAPLFRTGASAHALANDGSLANKSREEVAQILLKLSADKKKLRFIYTGGVSNFYNYPNQFADMFSKLLRSERVAGQLSWQYFPQADHLFMLQNHRDALLADIEQWILNEFTSRRA